MTAKNRMNRKRSQQGFTLVELMIVVAIIGILAVLAVFGVSKYMANAKTGEARNSLGMISKQAVAAYEAEKADNSILAGGNSGNTNNHQFCTDATSEVPANLAQVKDRKYQSSASDWSAGSRTAGWQCLKFSLTEAQYFQYGYKGTATTGFAAYAEADFKGQGSATNGFSIAGKLDPATGQVNVAQNIDESEGPAPVKAVP